MAEIVKLARLSQTERERDRFEQWAGSMLTAAERQNFFLRTVGGGYFNKVTSGAWAAWQARGLMDANQPFDSELTLR